MQLGAVLDILRLDDVLDDFIRKVRREVRDLVGIEVLGGGDDLRAVHVREQRVAHRVGDLEEDLALAVASHQAPDEQPILERQAFEDVGDVGGVQVLEAVLHQPRQRRGVHTRILVVAGREQALERLEMLLRRRLVRRGVDGSHRGRIQGSSADGMRARIIWDLRMSQVVLRLRS